MNVYERFGLPPEVLNRRQPLESVQIRVGELGPTQSGTNTKPIALDRFKVYVMDGEGYEKGEHELTRGKKVTLLPISFPYNDPSENIRGQIAAWTGEGGGPFCHNNRGGDVAMRKSKNGDYQPCRCDRTKCPMWLNAKGDNEKVKRMLERGNPDQKIPPGEFAAEFPYAKITRDLKCKPELYLLVNLDGVTAPGEQARFYTGSENSIRQIITCMEAIMSQTNGMLAGVPLYLKIVMKPARMQAKNQKIEGGARKRQMVPTVGIVARTTDYNEFVASVKEAVRARELSGVDWTATKALMGRKTMAEMTEMDERYIAQHFLEGEQREVAMEAQAGEIEAPPMLEDAEVEFSDVNDDEKVRKLTEALGFNQAKREALGMQAGGDIDKALSYLKALVVQRGLDPAVILGEAPAVDAEFTEVEDEAEGEEVDDAAEEEPQADPQTPEDVLSDEEREAIAAMEADAQRAQEAISEQFGEPAQLEPPVAAEDTATDEDFDLSDLGAPMSGDQDSLFTF